MTAMEDIPADVSKADCIKVTVASHHHRLTEDAFQYFMQTGLQLQVSSVTKRSFILSCYRSENDKTLESFYAKSHDVMSYFLIAINVASLGHFTWDFQFVPAVPYRLFSFHDGKSHLLFPRLNKYQSTEKADGHD